jgi:hypothetical protein
MTIYSSKTVEDLFPDLGRPGPADYWRDWQFDKMYYAMRADFIQNNPANPILAYARKHPGSPILWKNLVRVPTDAEKAHASEVLTRLARLRRNA